MENLIKALQIFMRHGNVNYPTHCEHDIMYIMPNDPDNFTEEEIAELETLGFIYGEDDYDEYSWYSYKYGGNWITNGYYRYNGR